MENLINLVKLLLSVYGFWILVALGTVLGLQLLSKFKSKIDDIELTLNRVKFFLRGQLGDKASAFIDVWLISLNAVKDGVFTEEEMVQEFIRIIKIKSSLHELTEKENYALEKAAQMTVQSITNNKPNKIVFHILNRK